MGVGGLYWLNVHRTLAIGAGVVQCIYLIEHIHVSQEIMKNRNVNIKTHTPNIKFYGKQI